jgi:hypothetical protein
MAGITVLKYMHDLSDEAVVRSVGGEPVLYPCWRLALA